MHKSQHKNQEIWKKKSNPISLKCNNYTVTNTNDSEVDESSKNQKKIIRMINVIKGYEYIPEWFPRKLKRAEWNKEDNLGYKKGIR
jgi:hypothetical protein